MNPLVEVEKLGQSIWYDNIRRLLIDNGDIAGKIADDDLRGITSNPTIFEKAIGGSTDYNDAMQKAFGGGSGKSITDIYESLAVEDIQRAADLFKSVYERTNKLDGYVSLEVSPLLARDTAGTVAEAKRLWATLGRPNVCIKIPATPEGIPAIRQAIAAGININVTMIFALENYEEVADAFISGLEDRDAAGQPVDHVASVASVFVSRIDAAVDKDLEARISATKDDAEKVKLTALLGKAAIANAKIQYQKFKEIFGGDRFANLKAKGAQVQRPLWASTGTKNPAYSDVLYVDSLIAAQTVNTIPPATYTAFRDHGTVKLTIEDHLDEAKATLAKLDQIGIDLRAVCLKLQNDGVKSFADSFDSLMKTIQSKQAEIKSGASGNSPGTTPDRMEAALGKA